MSEKKKKKITDTDFPWGPSFVGMTDGFDKRDFTCFTFCCLMAFHNFSSFLFQGEL